MSATPARTDDPRLGILSMVVATVLYAAMWAVGKSLSGRYSVLEITFLRSICGFIPLALMVATSREPVVWRPHRVTMHVWRAAIGVTGLGLVFLANHLMPLADAQAITFAAPLLVTALSAPLLGERVGLHRWGAVGLGFAGVLLIVRPSGEVFNAGALVAIVAALAMALTQITIRQLNRTDRPLTIVIYFTLFSTLFTALPMPFVWITPTLEDWGLALLMGLLGGSAQYFVTSAFSLAPASVISPFNYAGLLWSGLLGWLIWSDIPETHVFLGAAVVTASGVAIIRRETRKPTG